MCDDCGPEAPVVYDHATGDEICSGCGLVLAGHLFDDDHRQVHGEAAWHDHVAAGEAGTRLDLGAGCGVSRRVLAAAQPPPAMRDGLRLVGNVAADLGFRGAGGDGGEHVVLATARGLYRDLNAAKTVRACDAPAAAAAAVYLACKLNACPREMAAVGAVAGLDAPSVGAAVGAYKDKLAGKAYHAGLFRALVPGDLVNAYVSRLAAEAGLDALVERRVRRAAHRVNERVADRMDCSRTPKTLCSGAVFLALAAENVAVPKKVVLKACGVCQQTLDKVVAAMQPHLA